MTKWDIFLECKKVRNTQNHFNIYHISIMMGKTHDYQKKMFDKIQHLS